MLIRGLRITGNIIPKTKLINTNRVFSSNLVKMSQESREIGPIESTIRSKLQSTFEPVHFEIFNDSYKHAHHAGLRGASNVTESHFRIVIVSNEFDKKGLPIRHRMIYKLLEEELTEKGVHALQLKTKTPAEWEKELAKSNNN